MVGLYVYAGKLFLLALSFYKHHYKVDPLLGGLLDVCLIFIFICVHYSHDGLGVKLKPVGL